MEIDEGYSMEYLIPGFFIALLGLILIYFNIVDLDYTDTPVSKDINWTLVGVGILLLLIASLLFLVKTGLYFSKDLKSIRAYKSLFTYKWGERINIENAKLAYILTAKGSTEMMSRGGVRNHIVQYYELILVDDNNVKQSIYSFTKRAYAVKALNYLKNYSTIKVESQMKRGKLN